ncbi:MAG TPA: ArsR family transcriptional regulator, partial [Vicinamibacterales bacterium]|nr:ArsR family transcriptional regulator [Vicinamibacterales bacterium]
AVRRSVVFNRHLYRRLGGAMTLRRDLVTLLSVQPRSVSSIAREMGLDRGDVEDHLRHAIRSARAAGHRVIVEPAKCRQCGFTFGDDKLSKPGKCPECRGTRLYEAQISIQ